MKSLLLATILFLAWTVTMGQNRDLETQFYNERAKIRNSKIRKIVERASQYTKAPCIKTSSEIEFIYEFNDDGDLIRSDQFNRGHLWKTTKYLRNKKGDYIQKSYNFYDSMDNVVRVDNWVFEFNKKGQRVLEMWIGENDTVRLNKLLYDKRGNCIEQFTNGWLKWRFKYDDRNRVIESNQCRLQGDSMQCYNLTKYHYKNGVVKRYVIYSNGDIPWKEFDYAYDGRNRLIEVKEQWHTLTQYGDDPPKEAVRVYITRFENDAKGNCVLKSVYFENVDMPFRCSYYDYEYY